MGENNGLQDTMGHAKLTEEFVEDYHRYSISRKHWTTPMSFTRSYWITKHATMTRKPVPSDFNPNGERNLDYNDIFLMAGLKRNHSAYSALREFDDFLVERKINDLSAKKFTDEGLKEIYRRALYVVEREA